MCCFFSSQCLDWRAVRIQLRAMAFELCTRNLIYLQLFQSPSNVQMKYIRSSKLAQFCLATKFPGRRMWLISKIWIQFLLFLYSAVYFIQSLARFTIRHGAMENPWPKVSFLRTAKCNNNICREFGLVQTPTPRRHATHNINGEMDLCWRCFIMMGQSLDVDESLDTWNSTSQIYYQIKSRHWASKV